MAYTPTDNPYIPGDPYSYDLKWIVQKVHELLDSMAALNTSQGNLQQSFEDLRQYVADYFASLDIAAEISAQIQQLYQDGYFDDIIADWITRNKVLLLDRDQSATFTDAEKAQGRKNLMAGGSNPNLLDNSWFTEACINQRGFTSETTSGDYTEIYTLDRWKVTRATLAKSSGYISFAWNGTNLTYGSLSQTIGPKSLALQGQRLTASVLLSDGTIHQVSYTAGTSTATYTMGPFTYVVSYNAQNGYSFSLRSYTINAQQIKAVKLEKGNYSTLANDTPPEQVTERNTCQYYAEMIDNASSNNLSWGYALGTGTNSIYMPFTIKPKRTTPTISLTGSIVIGIQSYDITATDVSIYAFSPKTGHGTLQITATGINVGQLYRVGLTPSTKVLFSADF